MRLYVPMCPNVANSLIHTYKHWEWLLVVPICPWAPMWPKIWDTAISSNTYITLCTYVSVCAHVPPCGQWFETQLFPLILVIHCSLMCLNVPICPLWLMDWYLPITSETGSSLWDPVSVCAHVFSRGWWFYKYLYPQRLVCHLELMWLYLPKCPFVSNGLIPPITSTTCCPFWTYIYLCAHVSHVVNG